MKRLSHLLSFLAVALFLLATGTVVQAQTDPHAGGGGGGSCASFGFNAEPSGGSASQTFFSLPTTGSDVATNGNCVIDFRNNTGMIVTNVTVTLLTAFNGEATGSLNGCDILAPGVAGYTMPSPFNNCNVTGNNSVNFNDNMLEGPDAWFPGQIFGLTLGVEPNIFGFFQTACGMSTCPNLQSMDARFDAKVVPTPEPATMVLVGSGLLTLVARRKKLREGRV